MKKRLEGVDVFLMVMMWEKEEGKKKTNRWHDGCGRSASWTCRGSGNRREHCRQRASRCRSLWGKGQEERWPFCSIIMVFFFVFCLFAWIHPTKFFFFFSEEDG